MYHYKVTFHHATENGLSGIELGEDAYAEFIEFDSDGRETYDVYSEYVIDTQLDQREQVKCYSR